MKKAITLVEMMIVVAILGILAAISLPTLQGHTQKAKEAAAKENLRTLRNAIERYEAKNGVAPGFYNNDPGGTVMSIFVFRQLVTEDRYLTDIPANPFNGKNNIKMLRIGDDFGEPTGNYGWLYKPATKDIRLDYPDTDSQGRSYFDY